MTVDDSTVEDACQAQTTILLQRSVAVEHHNVQLAEQRVNRRWGRATLVAVLLTLIPNFPAWSAVLVPTALVALYEGLLVWRKRQHASDVTRISARLTRTHHDVSEDPYS
jgi:type III secretory pathway component EscV